MLAIIWIVFESIEVVDEGCGQLSPSLGDTH